MRPDKKGSKKIYVKFSIPEEINVFLHSVVEKRGLNEFVTKGLQKALEEEQDILRQAYAKAN